MKRTKTRILLCFLLCLTLISSGALPLFAQYQAPGALTAQNASKADSKNANGEFVISVLEDGQWKMAGRLGYDMFLEERTLELSSFLTENSPAEISIVQEGGESAHLDSVFLGGEAPQSVNFNDEILLQKLSKKDLDLINAAPEGIELVFPANRRDNTLTVTGRIEGEKISQEPFKFPVSNNYKEINQYSDFYTYKLNSVNKVLMVDGNSEEVLNLEPLFKEYCISGTGHPEGYVYAWVMNDQDYLYAVMDITPDNTMDGDKDYAKLYVKAGSEVKEFKISVPETKWGQASFTYTDKVEYQHKLYEFKIPLSEIGKVEDSHIELAFSGYGTWALPYYQIHPDLAYNTNAGNYLVVYEGIQNGLGIYAQLADANAEWIDDYKRIDTDLSGIYDDNDSSIYSETPVVAYDSSNDRFLVVWECSLGDYSDAKLVGQFLNPDGSNDGSTFIISEIDSYAESSPAIAYNNINGEFLVVWEDDDHDNYQSGYNIYGRVVDYDKTPKMGEIRYISADAGKQSNPSVAYGNDDNCYMVVWENIHEEGGNTLYDIYGCTFENGNVTHTFPVEPSTGSPTDNTRRNPSVTYNTDNEKFIVVWADNRKSSNGNIIYDLYAAAADKTSSGSITIGDEEMYSHGTYYDNISIEYNSYWNNTCAVWTSDYDSYYLLTSGYKDNVVGYGAERIYPAETQEQLLCGNPSIAANTDYNSFVVAYSTSLNDYNNNGNVYLKLIGEQMDYEPKEAINPALAYNSNENNYLLVYSSNEYYVPTAQLLKSAEMPTGETSYTHDFGITGQFISNTAVAQGPPFQISEALDDINYYTEGEFPDVAFGDGKYMVVWAEAFENPDKSYMTTVNIMGNILNKDGASYTGGPFIIVADARYDGEYFYENNLNVTYGEEGKFLVAYSDGEDILGRMVSLNEVDNETPIISDTDISICTLENYQSAPSVAYSADAHRFLVVWQDDRNDDESAESTGSNLYGRLFDKDGLIVDPTEDDLEICTAAENQYGPSVAYNSKSKQFAATWYETNNEGEEDRIYGRHFDTDGLPVEAGEKLIISKAPDAGLQEYRNLSTVYNPTTLDEYFSVWSTLDYDEYDTWGMGQHISNDLTASGSRYNFGKDIYNGGKERLDVACNTNEGNYLVAYPCETNYYDYAAKNLNSESSYPEYGSYIKWELIGEVAPPAPGKLQFEFEQNDVSEDAGTKSIKVIRTDGSNGQVKVNYSAKNLGYINSATPGTDYIAASGTLIFENGEVEKAFDVTILNDDSIESYEHVGLELSEPTGGAELGSISSANLYINDDDSPNVRFSSSTYTVTEDVYEKKGIDYAEIKVLFSGFPDIPMGLLEADIDEETVFSVVYETSNDTAIAGNDYESVSGTLDFGWAESERIFRVPIIDDSVDESNEKVNLKLNFPDKGAYISSSSGEETISVGDYSVILGIPKTAVLTIADDDEPTPTPPPSKPKGNKKKKSSTAVTPLPVSVETPPPVEGLPNNALVDRMPDYIALSTPTKISEIKNEISLAYNKDTLAGNPGHDARIYYWRPDVKKWVALATYPDGDGKVKAINDGGYKGWFVVFGVVQPHFSDVGSHWAEQLINRMNGLGLIEGYEVKDSDLRVARPEQKVTRAEFTMFVTRIMNMNPDNILLPGIPDSEVESILSQSYTDAAEITPWARAAAAKATKAGLVPFEGSSFKPLEPITRIEAAVMVSRALKQFKDFKTVDLTGYKDFGDIPGWAAGQVVENALEGYPDNTMRPNEDIARAESLAMLLRLFIKGLGW